MRLKAPSKAPLLDLVDIQGQPVRIGTGRRTLLCFFRDAACPFCNFRIYELTSHYPALSALDRCPWHGRLAKPVASHGAIARQVACLKA